MNRPVASAIVFILACAASTLAAPSFVAHDPNGGVFTQPADITQREPLVPREDEAVQAWIKIGPSFTYNAVAIYYTDDGSEPMGSQGVPQPGTSVLLSYGPDIKITFQFNEPGMSGNDDWWLADFPVHTRGYGDRIRYKISAWDTGAPVPEVFAGGGTTYEWTNKIAWPGAGAGSATPSVGYPPVSFWKEEGVVGNHYINVMIDQNGTLYDVYYPSAGCVQGIATKNEGYSDGPDTFPALLPPDNRGQMHMNQAMAGLRLDGITYWLSNENGVGYSAVDQDYVTDTNVIRSYSELTGVGGKNISVEQYDFAPINISYPLDDGSNENRGLYLKRYILTNNGGGAEEVNFYYYADFALNGGDGFDGMFTDAPRGAMVCYDNTLRNASSAGEYDPTTGGGYTKDVSVYLAAAMRTSTTVGASSGTPATDFWSDTSSDQDRGWIGSHLTLAPGVPQEVDVLVVGGFDDFPSASGTYDFQMDNAVDWFLSSNIASLQSTTEQYWLDWLDSGVDIDFPDDQYDEIFRRSLLATALHLDGANGGIIAGMHNGAYPFVWGRDGVWAAITLARTAHVFEAERIYDFLRDVAYRDVEGWGRKGFWKQKYTTDGHTIWAAPQVDETSCYPWGLAYIYDVTGDVNLLADHYDEVYEAAIASSQSSTNDSRLSYNATFDLMDTMNLWEDSYDLHIYSNASVIRGLEDAARIADILDQQVCPGGPGTCNYHNDKALFESRATAIRGGVAARIAWDGENSDISLAGIVYPFEIYAAGSAEAEHIFDRFNGVATDTFGNNHPLVNFGGEWDGLINRYWGDTYWNNAGAPNPNCSPWFLTTLWYGAYYAQRQDVTANTGDIDNHQYRIDLVLDELGPIGLGAEQIAPSNSLLHPGQTDFTLQTAWPNAWESMSFIVDAMMLFLDYTPDAPGNTFRIEPKLPSNWNQMAFSNLRLGAHRIDVLVEGDATSATHTLTNRLGGAFDYETVLRVPAGSTLCEVTQDGTPIAYTYDSGVGRVTVAGSANTGAGATTVIRAALTPAASLDGDADVDSTDLAILLGNFGTASGATHADGDIDGDGDVDSTDLAILLGVFGLSC